MILYEKDFHEEGAIVDTETNNASFIRISRLYKRMGIENNKFMLALYDKELQGRDPHNLQDDSIELRMRVAHEAKINFWFFIRECVKIASQGSLDPGHFVASRANIAMSWVFLNNIMGFLVMPRQLGKTWSVVALKGWPIYIAGQRVSIGLFAKDSKLVQENVDRLKTLRDALPQYMLNKKPADTDNKEGLTYEELDNAYMTFVPPGSQRAASSLARGETFSWLHWDELPYFNYNYLAWPSAISTTSAAQPNTREAGLPAANVITTTAGMLDSREGKFAHNMKSNAMRFSEECFDLQNEDKFYEQLERNSTNNVAYLEFNYAQLGMSDEWLEERRKLVDDEITFATDYLNKWIHGSGKPLFPKHILDKLHACRMEPVKNTLFYSLVLRWYIDPDELDKNTPIIFGSDTSDNVGRDFTTLVGVNPRDMSTVVTINCNESNLTYVAQCIIKFLESYPRSVFIPERNKNGAFLVDIILASIKSSDKDVNPWTRIYNNVVQQMGQGEDKVDIHRDDPTDNTLKKHFGFWTSASADSRKFLYKNVLMNDIEKNVNRIYDSDIIDQVNTLVVKNGRVDHLAGEHDDVLVARLLASYLILFGRNLHVYGLDPHEMMSGITESGEETDPGEKEREKACRERVQQIDEWLEDSSIPEAVKRQHRAEKKYLLKFISDEEEIDPEHLNLSRVTDEEEEKQKQRKTKRPITSEKNMNILSKYV